MKFTTVVLNGDVAVPEIGGGGGNLGQRYLRIGDPCSAAFGGGKIASLEYDRAAGALVIRKDCKFAHKERREEFDCISVPYLHVARAHGVEEPKQAQPVAQAQGQAKGK